MRILILGCAALSLATFYVSTAADGPLTPRLKAPAERAQLRSDTDLVLINATVLDRQDRLVDDLQPEQLRLFEENRQQRIASFSLEDVPVSVIVVVDLSRSMEDAIPDIHAAMAEISRATKPGDEYMLIAIRGKPTVVFPFGSRIEGIEQFASAQKADGRTALIDALVLAFHEARSGHNARKAIVLLSDGYDTASRFTWSELRRMAREAAVPIYSFMLPSYNDSSRLDEVELESIVNETGGRYVYVKKPRMFPEKLAGLDVHRQYIIGYSPESQAHDGKYRRVSLKVLRETRKLRVFWRQGYYAPDW